MTLLLSILLMLPVVAGAAFRVPVVTNRSPAGALVTVAWDASPTTNVTGYNVYFGSAPRTYSMVSNAGPNTMQLLRGLRWGETNYIAATAYDSWGLESDYSTELAYVPKPRTNVVVTMTAPGWVEMSLDLQHWVPWSGSCMLTNPVEPRMFWRGNGVKVDRQYTE